MKPADTTVASTTPTSAAGKNDKSAQKHLYRLNPNPQQGYEVVLTIQDAPGPFEKMGWSAMYQATGCNYVVDDWAGVRAEPRRVIELPFTQRPDGSQVATVYLDALLDEDYYGNGVCKWTLTGAGPFLQASGAPSDTTFGADLEPEQLQAEQAVQLFYPNRYYPRTESGGMPTFGKLNRAAYSEQDREQVFSMTLMPRRVQP